jgi:hypothetical protein
MRMTVGVYAPNPQGQVGKVGEIQYDGKRITVKPADNPMLKRIATTPLKLLGQEKPVDAKREPEKFMRRLHERYRSPYLTCLAPSVK